MELEEIARKWLGHDSVEELIAATEAYPLPDIIRIEDRNLYRAMERLLQDAHGADNPNRGNDCLVSEILLREALKCYTKS